MAFWGPRPEVTAFPVANTRGCSLDFTNGGGVSLHLSQKAVMDLLCARNFTHTITKPHEKLE